VGESLVAESKHRLYLHDLDAETLRYLAEALHEHAFAVRAEEQAGEQKKMRHAHSGMLFLWAERFRTDANRLEDSDG
jgi:hypothetical protein